VLLKRNSASLRHIGAAIVSVLAPTNVAASTIKKPSNSRSKQQRSQASIKADENYESGHSKVKPVSVFSSRRKLEALNPPKLLPQDSITIQTSSSVAVLHCESESVANAEIRAEACVEDGDTDSDGFDCLVANETLQFSTDEFARRKSPEVQKIKRRATLLRGGQIQKKKFVGSFCAAVGRKPHEQGSARRPD